MRKKLKMDKRLEAFKRLLDIMDDLRKGCPWDKKTDYREFASSHH